jgi:uncharacterized protein (DUF2249 family)/TusA-related sulfurtransferase
MKINQHTKISTLIKENPGVIDVIVSINKRFEKLNNPLLRKIFASRVTIADAAKIGGTTVQVFYEKLASLGFQCENMYSNERVSEIKIPDFYSNIKQEHIVELDVRDDISKGKDPFNKILETLNKMPDESVLKLINSFEPTPLINLLSRKGYVNYVLHKESALVYTFLKRETKNTQIVISESAIFTSSHKEIECLITSFGEKITHIDVRELEMPMPMVTILKELETLPQKTMLSVLHRKIPIYLFPEIETRGYLYKVKQIDEDKVQILIYK